MPARRNPAAHPELINECGGERKASIWVRFSPAELEEMDRLARQRHCDIRGQLIRVWFHADRHGHLMILDDATHNLAKLVGQAIGGVVGQIVAEADMYAMSRGLGKR